MSSPDPYAINAGLSEPADDGQADHLEGLAIPRISLPSTAPREEFFLYSQPRSIVFCYPATGILGRDPLPDWDLIPGAPGCTVQALGFKKLYAEFEECGFRLAGLSTQALDEQAEFVERNRIPYPLFSDSHLTLTMALRLPQFEAHGQVFLRRSTLIIEHGMIVKAFYPVFPPHENATRVLDWIENGRSLDQNFAASP